MRRWYLVVGAAILLTSIGVHADQTEPWSLVCDNGGAASARPCYLFFSTGDRARRDWLGIAVQRLDGEPEIQVASGGHAYSRAEINAQSDTTIVTDYCYGSYCVFVQADELIEQFRKGARADIRLYNGKDEASVKESVSLQGFTKAYESYLGRIGE
jgi:Invasion associated locus B (IalB) protein